MTTDLYTPSSALVPALQNGVPEEATNGVKWKKWLAELHMLPADAPEWESIGSFVRAIQQLEESKRQERENRVRLQQALALLATQCTEAISFFGLTDEVAAWIGKACSLLEGPAVVEQVEQFHAWLVRHQSLRQEPVAATLADELPRRKVLIELEDHIVQAREQLVHVFGTIPPEAVDPSPARVTPPEERQLFEEIGSAKPSAPLTLLDPAPPPPAPVHTDSVEKPAELTVNVSPAGTEPTPESLNADSVHAPLDGAARQYNPLTHEQQRRLNTIRFGVGLVFASEALGFSNLVGAYKRFIPPDLPEGVKARCTEIPSKVVSNDQIQQWLRRSIHEHKPEEHLVVYRTLSNETKDQLLEQVQAALELCRQPKHGQRPGVGVLFLFDPKATWTWLSMPSQDRQALEDQIDVMTFPRRWDILGVRQRLTQHNKMDSDEVCRQVLQATGGWPYLLDVLFYRCGLHEDPRPFAQAIEREFIEHSTKLVQQFRSCLGLAGHDIARRVLEFVHYKKEVSARLVTPDALGGTPPLTPTVCDAAVEYLWRMGCVEVQDSLLSVEPVVGRMLTQS